MSKKTSEEVDNNMQLCQSCGCQMTMNPAAIVNDCASCGNRLLGAQTPPIENLPDLCPICRHSLSAEHGGFGCSILSCMCTATGAGTIDAIKSIVPNAAEKNNGSAECKECKKSVTADGKGGWTGHAAMCSTGQMKNSEEDSADAAQTARLAEAIKHESQEIEARNATPTTTNERAAAGFAAYGKRA